MLEKPFNTTNQKISVESSKNDYSKDQIIPGNIDPLQDEIKLQYTYFKNKHTPNIAESLPPSDYHLTGTDYRQQINIVHELSKDSELKIYFQNNNYSVLYKRGNCLQDFLITDLLKAGTNLWNLTHIHSDKNVKLAEFVAYFKQYLEDHNKDEVNIEDGLCILTLTKSSIMDLVQDFLVSYNIISKEYFVTKTTEKVLLDFEKSDYFNTEFSSTLLNFKQNNILIKQFLTEPHFSQFLDQYFPFPISIQRSTIIRMIEENLYKYVSPGSIKIHELVNYIHFKLKNYNSNQLARRGLVAQEFKTEDVNLFIQKYFADHTHKDIVTQLANHWWQEFHVNKQKDEDGLCNAINETFSKNFLYLNIIATDDMQEMRDGLLVKWDKKQFDDLLKQKGYENNSISVSLLSKYIRQQLPLYINTLQLPNRKCIYFIKNFSQFVFDCIINHYYPQSITKIMNTKIITTKELTVSQLTAEVGKSIPGIAEHRIKLFSESFIAMKRGTIKAQMQRELEPSERTIDSKVLPEFTQYVKDVLLYESHATLKDLFDHYLTEFRDYQNPPIAWPEFNSYWKEYRNLYKSKFDRVYAKNRTNVQVAMPIELVGDFLQFLYDMSVKKLKFARGTRDLQTKEQMQQSFIQYIESWREKSRLSQETK